MIDLDALLTFVTAARAGSFAAAGRTLGVTPAMIGRRIARLEAQFGARLIERTTRAQRLTTAGETMLTHAEAVLEAHDELREAMHSAPSQLDGRIRLTGPATLGVHRLAPVVAAFCAEHPSLSVEFVVTDRPVDLVAEGFDLAVRIGRMPDSALIRRLVGTYRFAVVASPGHVERYGAPRTPDDLSTARCVVNLNMSPRGRWRFFAADGAEIVAEIAGQLLIDNGDALRAAALAGAGLAYVPFDLVADDLATGRLVRLLPDWQTATLPIHLVHPSRRIPRRVAVLMDTLAAALRESHPL